MTKRLKIGMAIGISIAVLLAVVVIGAAAGVGAGFGAPGYSVCWKKPTCWMWGSSRVCCGL